MGRYAAPGFAGGNRAVREARENAQTVVVKPDPPQVRCEHSEQTRTVPSANGGTTEVTILRC